MASPVLIIPILLQAQKLLLLKNLGDLFSMSQCKYLILSCGITPSVYYYFQERSKLPELDNIQCIDTSQAAPRGLCLGKDVVAVIVRHVGLDWLWWLYRHQNVFKKIVYFMDDDMPIAYRASELDWKYGFKTTLKFKFSWFLVKHIGGELWCSTTELVERYKNLTPHLVPPIFKPEKQINLEQSPVYFYHGTWAHRHEIAWLVPIVREIQKRFPSHTFEIFGNRHVRKIFAEIPRVRVLDGISWGQYLERSKQLNYQVGLAPCFDSPYNKARSHTKLFDITRVGAVGVYSNESPYKEIIIPGQTGILVENNPQAWIEEISKLLETSELKKRQLYSNTFDWLNNQLKPPLPSIYHLPS